MKSNWKIAIALAAIVVGLAAIGTTLHTLAQPAQSDTQCEMPETCAASIELVRAQERFRIAYLMETGACSKEAACSTGVRPNMIGGREAVLSMHAKNAVQSCEAYCDEDHRDNEEQRMQCRSKCQGNKPIL